MALHKQGLVKQDLHALKKKRASSPSYMLVRTNTHKGQMSNTSQSQCAWRRLLSKPWEGTQVAAPKPKQALASASTPAAGLGWGVTGHWLPARPRPTALQRVLKSSRGPRLGVPKTKPMKLIPTDERRYNKGRAVTTNPFLFCSECHLVPV